VGFRLRSNFPRVFRPCGPNFRKRRHEWHRRHRRLTEASGVVASHNNANVLWTHNDSGHPAQVFAIDTQGRLLGTYAIPGNTDNEDIAIGPGPVPNVSYLYVGDIGDNGLTRANIKVYQIPEPFVYERQYTNPVTAR